jgi:hypothetical protein
MALPLLGPIPALGDVLSALPSRTPFYRKNWDNPLKYTRLEHISRAEQQRTVRQQARDLPRVEQRHRGDGGIEGRDVGRGASQAGVDWR